MEKPFFYYIYKKTMATPAPTHPYCACSSPAPPRVRNYVVPPTDPFNRAPRRRPGKCHAGRPRAT